MTRTVSDEIIHHLARLGPKEQQMVLEFTRALASATPPGTSGHTLMRFAGTITPEDAAEIMKAVDEDCEQVCPDE